MRAAGLQVSSLCRGGFFTRADPDGRRAARADNLAAIAEAAELGTDTLVLVCGGLVPGQRDLGLARRMIADAIGELVPEAQRLGVRLGIEALHPMFCADRCVISSLGEAVDLALRFPADAVGVVVDTYHVWWDARLADEIARAGRRIVSYQVCDWVLPLPQDTLLGRGHLGDGVIDFAPISASVAAAGYDGYVEVEIFNAEVWDAPPDQTAATVRERFAAVLGGPRRFRGNAGATARSIRRVLSGEPVHRLPDEVGVADVPRVLLDQVDQDAPQAGRPAVRSLMPGELAQVAVGQGLGDRGAGPAHRVLPQRIELPGGVPGGRVPFPVGVGVPVHRVPRRSQVTSEQPPGEVLVLDQGQVLEQAAQGHRRGADGRLQAGRVQAPALPRQHRALALQRAQQGGGLIARHRRFGMRHGRESTDRTEGRGQAIKGLVRPGFRARRRRGPP